MFFGASQLALLDATAQADLVRTGQVTAVELVEAAIDRIDALNPRPTRSSRPRIRRRWLGPSPGRPAGSPGCPTCSRTW